MAKQGEKTRVDDFHLYPRQVEMFELRAQGYTCEETGIIMGISRNTVRVYIKRAVERCACRNELQVVAKAIKLGIIQVKLGDK